MKNASKRRSQKERRVVGQEEFDQMELESMAKDEKILALEIKLAQYKDETLKNDENLQKLSKLYELGVIDENGELITKY